MKHRARALVVDEDPAVRTLIRDVLEAHQVQTLGAANGAEAVETLKGQPVQLLFAETNVGQDLLRHALQLRPAPIVLGLVDHDVEGHNELLALGLFDLIAKPLRASSVELLVHRALKQLEVLSELIRLREDLQSREGYHQIVGRAPAMERLREQLDRLAPTDATVWFTGEEGSGKELAARTLHARSSRGDRAFVVVNCAGLTESAWEGQWLLDGAGGKAGNGILHQTQGGTLYLDGIGQLALPVQENLVRLLDHPVIAGSGDGRAGIRVLAASRRDPNRAVQEDRLLKSLYQRLAQATIHLPRMSERLEDVPLLARHFVSRISEINHLEPLQISPEALGVLDRYPWPGNVQELRNAVEHAVILAVDGIIRPTDLPDRIRDSHGLPSADPKPQQFSSRKFREIKREVVEQFERAYLSDLMRQHWGNVTSASQQAGMLRSALQRLLRKYGLKSAEFREAGGSSSASESRTSPLD